MENPSREKPREPTNSEISLYERGYKDEDLGGNELEISLRQRAVTIEYHYVSLSFSLFMSLSIQQSQQRQQNYKGIALSYIYTYMTLGVFTNMASSRPTQNIFTYVSLIRFAPNPCGFLLDSLDLVSRYHPDPI